MEDQDASDNTNNTTDNGKRVVYDPESMNLRQLRIELKRMGLSPSGSKADLVKRYTLAVAGEDGAPIEIQQKEPKTIATPSRPKKEANLNHNRDNSTSSKRKSKPATRILMSQSKIQEAEVDELSNSDNEDVEEPAVQDDSWQIFQSFYNRRKSIGLDDDEIERRKRARIEYNSYHNKEKDPLHHPTEYPPQYSSEEDNSSRRKSEPKPPKNIQRKRTTPKIPHEPDDYTLDVAQLKFFDQAELELERIKLQKKYDAEISQLEHQVHHMRKELAAKDQMIETLRSGVFSRGVNHIPPATGEVQEVVFNWVSMHKLMK